MDLTPEMVFALIQSKEPFPVDFDDAVSWWDCRTKNGTPVRRDNLVRKLKSEFLEGTDFTVLKFEDGRRPDGTFDFDRYFLTVECFKMMGMMLSGGKGRQIRKYFVQCEIELKRRLEADTERNKQRVVRAIVSNDYSRWQKRFENEFFDEAYRVTGWQPPHTGHSPCMAQFINETIYNYFPDGTQDRLNAVNPRVNGRRKRKQHQHLTPSLGSPILESQKTAVIAVMRLSPSNNRERFRQNMRKALGSVVQIELPFMEDDQAS